MTSVTCFYTQPPGARPMRAWVAVIVAVAMWSGAAGAQEVSDFELRAAYCLGRQMQLKSFSKSPSDQDCRNQAAAAAPYGSAHVRDTEKLCRLDQETGRHIDGDLAHLRAYLVAKGFGAPNHPADDGDMAAIAAGQRDQKGAFGHAFDSAYDTCRARCASVDGASGKVDCIYKCMPDADSTGVIARLYGCQDLLKALPF